MYPLHSGGRKVENLETLENLGPHTVDEKYTWWKSKKLKMVSLLQVVFPDRKTEFSISVGISEVGSE